MDNNSLYNNQKNMETHLTIKHLAPYLPYDLNVYVKKLRKTLPMICLNKNKGLVQVTHDDRIEGEIVIGFKLEHVKPILRPMSDLITYMIDGDISVYKKLSARTRNDWEYENPTTKKWSYEDILILLQNHFDIFGLIDKGLAIPIHDVGQVVA